MLFFKAEARILNKDWQKTFDSKEAANEVIEYIQNNVDSFNSERDDYFFVEELTKYKISLAAVVNGEKNIEKRLKQLLEYIDFEVKNLTIKETGIRDIVEIFERAERNRFVPRIYPIMEKFGLNEFNTRFKIMEFIEEIIDDHTKEYLYDQAKKCMCDETLLPELDRIYAGSVELKKKTHPVHYMLNISEDELFDAINPILVSSLHQNNRLMSRRYCIAEISDGPDSIRIRDCIKLYKAAAGGTVVLNICLEENEEYDDEVTGEYETIKDVCNLIKKHRNDVLTILCFSNQSKKIKSAFYENLHNMSFIEIEEDLSEAEKALSYLKNRAKEYGVRFDKNLGEKVEEGQKYYTKELNAYFEEWYQLKIKNSVFPQYKEVKTIKKTDIKKEKGSAYDELAEMIGLDESKKIIDKALDYYRAQKMFAEKGMKTRNPAMHMVFTGNPGTAKTSVARLFARILRDNKVLSSGHMVEVGRGDLVGKYVGWTAKTVENKFSQAMGGVLFIDEAYSLVDDRNGSFGDEAINTIVQEMENRREDLVVIFAGYPKEMEKFLEKNPGLRSRIAFHVPFDDYNADELCDIAKLMAKKDGMTFTDDALDKMHGIFDSVCEREDFGNGRFVRNIIEDARMAQASRLVTMDFDTVKRKDIMTLKACDIEMPVNYRKKEEKTNAIGFVS